MAPYRQGIQIRPRPARPTAQRLQKIRKWGPRRVHSKSESPVAKWWAVRWKYPHFPTLRCLTYRVRTPRRARSVSSRAQLLSAMGKMGGARRTRKAAVTAFAPFFAIEFPSRIISDVGRGATTRFFDRLKLYRLTKPSYRQLDHNIKPGPRKGTSSPLPIRGATPPDIPLRSSRQRRLARLVTGSQCSLCPARPRRRGSCDVEAG